jgi:hypothetical protein
MRLKLFCFTLVYFFVNILNAQSFTSSYSSSYSTIVGTSGTVSNVTSLLRGYPIYMDDEATSNTAIILPFSFPFGIRTFNTFGFSSNGAINFNGSNNTTSGNLNNYLPDNTISAIRGDLFGSTTDVNSSVWIKSNNVGGHQIFTIEYNNWGYCCSFAPNYPLYSMQIELRDDGRIRFLYDHPTINFNFFNGNDIGIGMTFDDNTIFGVDGLGYNHSSNNLLYGPAKNISTSILSFPNEANKFLIYTFFGAPDVSNSLSISNPIGTLTSNCAGIPSVDYATFDVTGSNLSSTVNVSAPSGFEISTVSNTSYASSLSLTPVSNTVSSTLYIRLLSGATNNVSGTITALATTTGGSSISSTTTVSSTIASAPIFTGGTTYNLCKDATYPISLTVANSYNGWSTPNNAITVNNGYVTAGASAGGPYTVSFTDACAQTASATITVGNSDISPAITDGQASYKINNTTPIPQGPTASLYIGYNGTNYYSATKPTNTGFYKANNQSGNTAGCPYPFQIFRCTTCPD